MKRHQDLALGSRAAANAAAAKGATGGTALAPRARTDADAAARSAAEPVGGAKGARGDLEFLPSALLIVDEPSSPTRRHVSLTLVALLAAAFAWSYFGRIASYAVAPGKVQAVGRTKVLEAQQSGQVIDILVHDGDTVEEGSVMVRLDPADAAAARTIIVDQLADLRGQSDRRRAEIAAAPADPIPLDPAVTWSDGVPGRIRDREAAVLRADLARLSGTLATLASQRTAAMAEVSKLSSMITAQKALVGVTAENSSMVDKLMQSGWNSRAKSLDIIERLRSQQVSLTSFDGKLADARANVATLDSKVVKTRQSFLSDATDALAAAERRIADLDQQLIKADRTLAQTTLRAPVSGVVHASAVTTVGQFVTPRQQLMQIVPVQAPVEIVAYVENSDVGFIRSGQDAVIKIDSFNYAVYGGVDGVIEQVGGDALRTNGKPVAQQGTLDGNYGESTAAQRTNLLKYPVTIRAKSPAIVIDGKPVALTPGMSVSVEIETENRRLIDYVASPLLELLSTAAHER